MRIAFVGKGGSGKTTLAVLFSQYVRSLGKTVLNIDADLNMHMQDLLGIQDPNGKRKDLSDPEVVQAIRIHLKGSNPRIGDVKTVLKTTPPGTGSGLIHLGDANDLILSSYAVGNASERFLAVGTYEEEDIGATCYHNHLAIFENVLSHLVDGDGVVVADMVAGVDAFANTLHAQFDVLLFVVEPTRRSLEVFQHYQQLAKQAGMADRLFVVGNKVRFEEDRVLITEMIPSSVLLGFVGESEYLRRKDREGGALCVQDIEEENAKILGSIFQALETHIQDPQARLEELWKLHRVYSAQEHVMSRHGDLTTQIDPEFDIRTV